MKLWKLASAITTLGLSASVNAAPIVLDFEGVSPNTRFSSYGGLDWSFESPDVPGVIYDGISISSYGDISPQGTTVIYQASDLEELGLYGVDSVNPQGQLAEGYIGTTTIELTGGGTFQWGSTTFSKFNYLGGESGFSYADLFIDGLLDGEVIFTKSVTSLISESPRMHYGGYLSGTGDGPIYQTIDQLVITSSNNWQMDNFTYEVVSTVPVPAAVWLFGSGLIGLVGMARRKKA